MATRKQRGRRAGGHNKGYWYYHGRGWYTTEADQQRRPLLDENGVHLKAPDTAKEVLERAFAKRLLEREKDSVPVHTADDKDKKALEEIILAYLDYSKANDRAATFERRADFLFDFCYGLPGRFRDKGNGRKPAKPTAKDRLHRGYGKVTVAELIPHHAQEWLDAHLKWTKDGGKRFAMQSLKRALNYAVEMRLITHNPLRGFKVSKGRSRVTYFTPEQEQAMYRSCKEAFGLALRVCIRTGARYGSEFAKLTDKHVKETDHGMEWHFSTEEAKNHKTRIILVAPEIAEIVRRLIQENGPGFVFRNTHDEPWTGRTLRLAFLRLRKRLAKRGIQLDSDAVLYTTRHTFAKRMLAGYWGHRVTLLDLADLMGDTRQTVIDHYTKWDDTAKARLWAGINSKTDGSPN